MRHDRRTGEVKSHQESQAISWANVRLPRLSSTHTTNRAWQWDYTGSETVVPSVTLGSSRLLWFITETQKFWPSPKFSLRWCTGERLFHLWYKEKNNKGLNIYNWVILSVTLMCHKAVFHVFSPALILHKHVVNEYHMWLRPQRRSRVI